MTEHAPLKAALIIVGNEILSGRTQDANIQWIAEKLGGKGITLTEVRVVPDLEDKIIKAIHDLRGGVDYLFTTGGIGPTHDDITAESVAKAFGVKLEVNAAALEIMTAHYNGQPLNEARMKMTMIPQGASLIRNPVSSAPGFIIGNVHVMAGVPAIMQGMLDNVLPTLRDGAITYSNSVTCQVAESAIAKDLTALQARYPALDIGSYPHFKPGRMGLSLVIRGTDEEALKKATRELIAIVEALDQNPPMLSLQIQID